MPAPASDAIASDVGHGSLGVRYGLRPFRDLLSETVGQRHLWIELRPKKVVSGWTLSGGGVYYLTATVNEVWDGVALDVVGVQTLTETLTRYEAGRTLVAGTYRYDTDKTLYVYLTAGANPANTTVVVQLGIHLGSHGIFQPILLPDRLVNGSLDAWIGAVPDSWSHAEGTGVTLDKTSSDPLQGSYAARFAYSAGTGQGSLYQNFTTLISGHVYRLSGAYRNTCAGDGITVRVYVWDTSGAYMLSDGRSQGVGTVFTDAAGRGEWTRFTFDFVCPSWATVQILLNTNVGSAQTGTVDFDDVKLSPVSRYAYHEPLLSVDSLPTTEAARADAFWGELSSALSSLTIANPRWEALIAGYDWMGAQCLVRVGGRYQLGANETLLEDCPVIASARLGAPVMSDGRITFDLQDDRQILQRTLPPRTYNNNTGGLDAYTEPDRGRSRPLLWNVKEGVRAVQYDIHSTGGGPIPLGKYEVLDATDWSTGLLQYVDWYPDDQTALARSSLRRVRVGATSDSTSSVLRSSSGDGRFDVLHDMRPLEITAENNKLHFDTGSTRYVAVLAIGAKPLFGLSNDPASLCSAIASAMNTAAGTSDIGCTFVDSTQKVRFTKTAGTLNLRCKTGDGTGDGAAQNGIWALLGFEASADKTTGAPYNADYAFTSQAFDQTLRTVGVGFADDASGTYTGVAGNAIDKPGDIARHMLRIFLGVPASAIDVPSFVATRSTTWGAKECSLYLGSSRAVADIFAELETSGNFDLILSGGVWYCLPRDTSVPAGTPELVDADFLSFEAYYNPEDLYGTVTITYDESPDGGEAVVPRRVPWDLTSMGRTKKGEVTDATVALRYGRPEQKVFRTCIRNTVSAAYPLSGSRLEALATQCSTKRRRFRFTTKGKALMVPVGGKLKLTRTKGLDTMGALSGLLVRVLRKRDDWARWVSDIEAIEVI